MQFTFFFFNDTATTEIYTLSLHDALPISRRPGRDLPLHLPRARAIPVPQGVGRRARRGPRAGGVRAGGRAQARERAWLALRGRGEHGARRCPPGRTRASAPDAPDERTGERAGGGRGGPRGGGAVACANRVGAAHAPRPRSAAAVGCRTVVRRDRYPDRTGARRRGDDPGARAAPTGGGVRSGRAG